MRFGLYHHWNYRNNLIQQTGEYVSQEEQEGESQDHEDEERQTNDCTDNTEHAAKCPAWKNMGYCEPGWRVQTIWRTKMRHIVLRFAVKISVYSNLFQLHFEKIHNLRLSSDDTYYEWMIINCAKTCGSCGEDTVDPTEESKGTG